MAEDLNRVQNTVNMRIAAPKIRDIIDKCDTFLDNLKSSPTFRSNALIYREFGSELKEMRSNIESIVDNQSASNRKLNVGNTSYVKKRIEKAKNISPEFSDVLTGGYVYKKEFGRRERSIYVSLLRDKGTCEWKKGLPTIVHTRTAVQLYIKMVNQVRCYQSG